MRAPLMFALLLAGCPVAPKLDMGADADSALPCGELLSRLGSEFDSDEPPLLDLNPGHHLEAPLRVSGGGLQVTPADLGAQKNNWYDDLEGVLLYQWVPARCDRFLVETQVSVTRPGGDMGTDLQAPYNSAGILLRHPDGAPGRHNWIKYQTGFPEEQLGRGVKITTNSVSDKRFTNDPTPRERLRVCRLGDTFRFYYHDGAGWRLEDNPGPSRHGLLAAGDPLQVGLMVGHWEQRQVTARFDYLRLREVSQVEQCDD